MVKEVEIVKIAVPKELLEIPPLPKPYANSEIEILNAYSMLFYHYQRCVINMERIKELNKL